MLKNQSPTCRGGHSAHNFSQFRFCCQHDRLLAVSDAAGALRNSQFGEEVVMASNSEQRPVANLPFSQGRSFASLDEYLEFRKKRGAYDVLWYREIKPGVYELVSRRGAGAQPRIYTRPELARMFGFAE